MNIVITLQNTELNEIFSHCRLKIQYIERFRKFFINYLFMPTMNFIIIILHNNKTNILEFVWSNIPLPRNALDIAYLIQ